MNKPQEYFKNYCSNKGLKNSKQRDKVVDKFLETEKHISAFRLYESLIKQGEEIGYSTVYRTLKLLTDAGLAQTIEIDGEAYFEHKFGHKHHDHFLCIKCGKATEFTSPKIERIQESLAKKHNFTPQNHSLIIYGLCKECNKI